jgi:allantoin racemase
MQLRKKILVVNPNSNETVTRNISDALQPFLCVSDFEVGCVTLAEGPYGIETQADSDSVVMPLRRLVAADNSADAFVIACYSDPGVHVCREATRRPVFGIAEAGVLSALARGERFGVIAIAERSIRRHMRNLRQLCLMDRLAGERSLDMSVAEAASGDGTLARMVKIGIELRDQDGADVIVMGCAGMSRHRAALENALGVPVIDPTQAAVTMAVGALMFQ